MQYVFTAVFTKDVDGTLLVNFPDLPGCLAQGKDMVTAVQNAESVLRLVLFDMEQNGVKVPKTRFPEDLMLREGEVASVIFTNTDPYHERFANKVTDHTLSVPAWLGQIADSSGLDLSRILQDAVKREIGMPVHKSGKGEIAIKAIRPPGEGPSTLTERTVIPKEGQGDVAALRPRRPYAGAKDAPALQAPRGGKALSALPLNEKKGSLFTYLIIGLSFLLVLSIAATIVVTQTDVLYNLVFRVDEDILAQEDEQMQMLMAAIIDAQRIAYEEGLLHGGEGDELYDPPGELYTPEAAGDSTIATLRQEFHNDEIVALLSIDGTTLSVPVLQGAEAFYREHDVWGAASAYGAVFLNNNMDISNPINHFVIHGDSSQYGELLHYLPNFLDQELFDRSPTLRLTTETDYHWFEIFSFYPDESEFGYEQVNSDSWGDWIAHFAGRSMHQTNVTVSEDDFVVTLVAYAYPGSRSRYIMHARLI